MRTKAQIAQLKEIPIVDYLKQQGYQPVKASGAELVYYSPKNIEATPSFLVNPRKNVFHDFSGEGEQGDIIRLVQYLTGCGFFRAVETLEALSPNSSQPFSFSGEAISQHDSSSVEIVSVQPLQNRSLLAYIASRRISLALAQTYLKEIHYRVRGKQYYAIGFRNGKGGYELRSQYFKGSTSPKWFSLVPVQNSSLVNVFEGVFDFLSCCEMFNVLRLKNSTLILNSLSFLPDTIPALLQYNTINLFLDNDNAGRKTIDRLKADRLNVLDCSHYYTGYKDFNEYLQAHRYA
ncbi:CHC2-type zinc finger protein [Spirosoma oryzae]|uniref:CHC2-type zinc finger protein n=1 Tax=Spirosoma oryzae TaxID=1469603 RepID=A0A2T0RJ37_9BACT|nr:toprim domain-containing protein [Spirosoma oryzae]PRY21120.1 CHC2-type zinc finger protein [Spirosoma oryzae]